jgi:hypothetical protein
MGTSVPVLGAGFTLIFLAACLSSPVVGVIIDWYARHRQQGPRAR